MQRSANMQAPSERAEGEKPGGEEPEGTQAPPEKPEGEEPEGENGGRGGPPDQIQVDSLLLSVLYFGQ